MKKLIVSYVKVKMKKEHLYVSVIVSYHFYNDCKMAPPIPGPTIFLVGPASPHQDLDRPQSAQLLQGPGPIITQP